MSGLYRFSMIPSVAITTLVVAGIVLCFFEIDKPVAEFISRNGRPEWAERVQIFDALSACGFFVLILGLLHPHLIVDRERHSRDRLIAVFTAFALSIVVVEIVRLLVGRIGPEEYLATGRYGFRLLSVHPGDSFPSEYGALAGVTAGILSTIQTKYRPTIALLAVLLPGTQLLSGTHFVSDILAGLAVGVLAFALTNETFLRRTQIRRH